MPKVSAFASPALNRGRRFADCVDDNVRLRQHRYVAACHFGDGRSLAREIYVSSARTSPVLKSVIHDYASQVGITLKAQYEGENLPAAMSLVTSTGGVTLIPLYAQNMLTPNVVARALDGVPPTIDLTLGYNEAHTSPLLLEFLSRADELVASVQEQSLIRYAL